MMMLLLLLDCHSPTLELRTLIRQTTDSFSGLDFLDSFTISFTWLLDEVLLTLDF